jgi:hypothetical protein
LGEGVLKPVVCPLIDTAYDVLELILPLLTELELMEPPRGDEEFDDELGWDWI